MKNFYRIRIRLSQVIIAVLFFNSNIVFAQNPGGVSGAALWLKANVGTNTTTDGGSITSWADQSGNSRNATQGTGTNQPIYQTSVFNFNPAVKFDGSNDYLIFSASGLPSGSASVEEFAVANHLNTSYSGWSRILAYGTDATGQLFSVTKAGSNSNANTSLYGRDAQSNASEFANNAVVLVDGKYTGTQAVISSFGVQRTATNFSSSKTTTNGRIGSNFSGGDLWNGNIPEIILYPTNLSASNVLKVNSYLAIKYGITLDQISAQNYVASDGTIVWNATTNSTYKNNITGIARDDNSALNQKQSKSVNSGLQVVIGNGNTIATDNASNTNNFSADRSALIWGDNAGSVSAWTSTGAPSGLQKIARTWKVQETGTVGSVKVQIADNSGTNGLPDEGSSTVILLVDADGDFTSGAIQYVMTLNGSNWETNVDFTSGQYFTFAICSNPVGIPVFSLGATSSRCQGAGTVTYTATATNSTSIVYSLDATSLAAGNTINSSTGAVTYVAGWSGTSTITATATGGCGGSRTATHTVTTNATVGTPVFNLGSSSTRCQGIETITYTATAANNTGLTYSLDATSLAAGNTINSSTGAVTYAAGWTGTATITVSASGCNGPKTATHTVTSTSTVGTPVFTSGSSSTRCQGVGTVTYSAKATNTTGITYSLDAMSLAAGNTINSSTGAVTYVAGWSGTSIITASAAGCGGPKTATHTVTTNGTVATPVFASGSSSSRCIGAGTETYNATATNSTSITYSLDATSLAVGNTINSSTGAVTYISGWTGTSIITASATGCGDPTTATHSATTNTVVAVNDSISGDQGNPFTINVLSNDLCNYDPTTLTIVSPPQNGDLQIGTGGQITYLPNGSFFGSDQLTYQICDAGSLHCSQAVVKFTVIQNTEDPCISATMGKTYYLPFPENETQLRKSLISAASVDYLTNNVRSVISIKITYPGTVITYDQWEDGYESDITRPAQKTTLVWGDGNANNGVAPGYPDDILPPGAYLVLDNQFAYNPRVNGTYAYDGKDKLYSTTDIVITKVTGDAGTTGSTPIFTVQNIKTNVYDTYHFGKYFVIPFGENVTNNLNISAFKYTGVFVRAMTNGTTVNLDYNGDGTVDVTQTLNEGEVWLYDGTASTPGVSGDVNQANDIKAGATITSNHPVGVDLLFGGLDSYGTRNLALLPGKYYGSTYYSPVYTTNTSNNSPVYAFFTNTLNSPITINWTAGTGATGSVTIPANSYNYLYLNQAGGYKFQSAGEESYTAVIIVDADSNGSTYDWAFNLISENKLTSYTSVAWAPGSNDGSANYHPVWVTAPNATTLYIKYDGKLATTSATMSPCDIPFDIAIPINALESYKIYDTYDKDQSGLAVYTCDGTKISAAWGEDPYANGATTPTSSPALDVGYVLEPRCLQQMVLANDERVTTEPDTPIKIAVLSNDAAFLCSINQSSLATPALQPSHGTIAINSDGTITYTPNAGYIGIDQFQYRICSKEYPSICDMATVTVSITTCDAMSTENIVKGKVFIEQTPDDGAYNNETGAYGIRVNLYNDANCNGIVDSGDVLVQQTLSDPSGNYAFSTSNGYNVKDDFDPTASFTGNDGAINWSNNWSESGDDGVITTGDVRIIQDAVSGNNAIRLSGASNGINRSVTFANATSALLKIKYRRQSISGGASDYVNVNLNGNLVYQIMTNSVQSDDYYTEIVIPLSSSQYHANASNTLQFITGGGVSTSEYFWIDNVELMYFNSASCYIAVGDPSNTGGAYTSSSLNKQTVSFTGLGSCSSTGYLGVLGNLTASNDNVNTATDIPVNINVLGNDVVGKPNPASVTVASQPTHGTVIVNSDGTITYTPNPGYNGSDTFTYTVCSMDDPNVCSTATVTVTISCISLSGVNVINGLVFNDVNNNGALETADKGHSGVTVNLYLDANGNGILDSGETTPIQTTNSASDGSYTFNITPPTTSNTYLDIFSSNYAANQTAGTTSWASNSWTEIGTNNGFATSPVTITSANGLAIMGNYNVTQYGAYRTANINGAISATLSFDYVKSGLDLDIYDYVDVMVANSANPNSWTLLKRITGADQSVTSESLSFDITPYISATTTIRFITSGSSSLSPYDIVYFDNVKITYNTPNAAKYIVQLAQPLPTGYILTTPTPSPTGIHTASFTSAGAGDCENNFGLSGADITITKTAQNQTPYVGSNATFTITATNKGTSNATNVVVNDVLPAGYTFVSATPSTGTWTAPNWTIGNLNVGASATLTIIAKVNNSGSYTNTTTITGSQSDPNSANNTSTTIPVPKSGNPIAINDINTTYVNNAVSGNVLTNDSDPQGLALTVTSETKTTSNGGSVTINSNGTYTYTPPAGFTGEDTFNYTVCNSLGICTTAAVVIEVMPTPTTGNDAPVAVNDNYSGSFNKTISSNVLVNDLEPDNNTLTVSSALVDTNGDGNANESLTLGSSTAVYGKDSSGATVVAGTLILNSNGTFDFVPVTGFIGTVTYSYIASDGNGGTDDATVTLNILGDTNYNSVVALNNANKTLINTSVSGNVLTNDYDPEGNTMTVTSTGTFATLHGSVVINTDGSYTYTPVTGFTGEDSFTYTVCDNGTPKACDQATVNITVMPAATVSNDAPVALSDAFKSSVNTTVTGSVLGNDYDVDGNLNTNSVTLVSGGTASANGVLTLNANGTFSFVPTTGFTGQVSFTYQVCDNGTPIYCDQAIVTIDILPAEVTNTTFAADDAFMGKENYPISGNVKTNDYDPQGNTQTVSTTPVVSPAHGSLVLNSDGTFTYTPNENYYGEDQFVYTICDNGTPQACDQATVYLTIAGSAPAADNDINQVPAGTTATGSVLTNDEYKGTATITSAQYYNASGVLTALPVGTATQVYTSTGTLAGTMTLNSNGTYSFVPAAGFTGTVPVNYTMSDAYGSDSATLTIEVIAAASLSQNDKPIAQDDVSSTEINTAVSSNALSNDSDADGNTLTISSAVQGAISITIGSATVVSGVDASGNTVSNAGTITLNADGTYTFTPATGFTGTVNPITYTISDGNGGTDTANISITVYPNTGNNVFANDDAKEGVTGTTLTGNVVTNDSDPEGNTMTVTAATANGTTAINIGTATVIPNVGTLTLNSNGSYTFVPVAGYAGTTSVVYTICDNGTPQACDQATLYLTESPTTVKVWVGNTSTEFGTGSNWSAGVAPNTGDDIVFATAENNGGFPAESDLILSQGSEFTIGNLTNESDKALVIPPATSLNITGTVTGSETDAGKILVQAADDGTTPNGTLILSGQPCDYPVMGTVQMFAKGYKGPLYEWIDNIVGSPTYGTTYSGYYKWQQFGIPVESVMANPTFYGSYLREYSETQNATNTYYKKWITLNNSNVLTGNFKGYSITQDVPKIITLQGALVFCDKTITLTRTATAVEGSTDPNENNYRYGLGQNVFGNSFTAAIDISTMNFPENVEQTVYLYNTGSFGDWGNTSPSSTPNNTTMTAGSYRAIPYNVSPVVGNQIPSMQGFLLRHIGTFGTNITMTMPYDQLIENVNPQSVPRKSKVSKASSSLPYLEIEMNSQSTYDRLWLFYQAGTSANFDNGWDGRKFFGTPTAYIYTPTPDGGMQINTSDNILDSYINFIGYTDSEYTLTLRKSNLDDVYSNLYLVDYVAHVVTPLDKDVTTYNFTADNNGTDVKRFQIKGELNTTNPDGMFLNAYFDGNNIQIRNDSQYEGTLQLFDVSGKTIINKTLLPLTNEALNNKLMPGVYLITMNAGKYQKNVKLIIK